MSVVTPKQTCIFPSAIKNISVGNRHGLVTLSDGRLFATGTAGPNAHPGSAPLSTDFHDTGVTGVDRAIASNDYSLLIRNGQAWGCGNNSLGQINPWAVLEPIFFQQIPPTLIPIVPVNVFTRERSSFWLLSDGRVLAVGDNTYGQLADTTAHPTGVYVVVDFH
jgi:hypothetical protein